MYTKSFLQFLDYFLPFNITNNQSRTNSPKK
jgi:hypothetical protein